MNPNSSNRLTPFHRIRTDKKGSAAKQWVFAKPTNPSTRADGESFKQWLPVDAPVSAEIFTPDPSINIAITPGYLVPDGWTQEECDKLVELANKYDYRWPVIKDRWPFPAKRDIVDLRSVFYSISILAPPFTFDVENERIRYLQLDLQFQMTREVETRQREMVDRLRLSRQHRDHSDVYLDRSATNKYPTKLELALRSPEDDSPATLRSSRMNMELLHPSVGLGTRLNAKVLEMLGLLEVPSQPMPTVNVCDAFDALRRDVVKLIAIRREIKKLRRSVDKKQVGESAGARLLQERKSLASMAASGIRVSASSADVSAPVSTPVSPQPSTTSSAAESTAAQTAPVRVPTPPATRATRANEMKRRASNASGSESTKRVKH